MINLVRKKDEKWIFQKNISSWKLIEVFNKILVDTKTDDKDEIKRRLSLAGGYNGRSSCGSANTMGVRFSQTCFYMFGYKSNEHAFIPSQTTREMLTAKENTSKCMLVNLFSIQFPHPYSKTPANFRIYAGRLILKLLLDERIHQKLYIDEMIWFLPFLKTINNDSYDSLIDSILTYRSLNYYEKLSLFKTVDGWENLFANCLHEINYYFVKIFSGFQVFDVFEDSSHNNGLLFKFRHGTTNTFRTDSVNGSLHSGYVALNASLYSFASKLLSKFNYSDSPSCLDDEAVYTKQQWIYDLYEIDLVKYLRAIMPDKYCKYDQVIETINQMTYMSKYSKRDGKEFENSLVSVFELFKDIREVDLIGGSGDTDLLCIVDDGIKDFKINVDAKSRGSIHNMNVQRLKRHLAKHSSKYCIVVAPRFFTGNKLDIVGEKIVMITAEALGTYCTKECINNGGAADFETINKIIAENLGTDISPLVMKVVEKRYGFTI